MALHTFSDDGNMGWTCPHCGGENTAHVSHPEVQYADDIFYDAAALPKCECGTQTFLKVKFSDQELKAPNMIDRDGNPTESHAVALRHMALAAQLSRGMQQIGPQENVVVEEARNTDEPAQQEGGNLSLREAMPSNPLAGLNA